MTKKKKLISVYDMCEMAIFTALAIVLGMFCEIKVGANGGSIGFAMVPLFFIAYRHGAIKGFICGGIIYGLAQGLYDGYIFQYGAISAFFDYIIPFGAIGLAGLFRKFIFTDEGDGVVHSADPYIYIILSVTLVFVIRYLSHVVSGTLAYDTPWAGSFAYNITYIAPTYFIDLIILLVLYYPLAKLNKIYPVMR